MLFYKVVALLTYAMIEDNLLEPAFLAGLFFLYLFLLSSRTSLAYIVSEFVSPLFTLAYFASDEFSAA